MKHSFIHVADVHLDRPLDNLRRRRHDLSQQLHESSRISFARTVDLAIARSVDAFLIAGDLFDGPIRDASAGLWVSTQFKKLVRHNIPVFLIRGNHDAANASAHSIQWPKGVTEFATAQAETHLVESANFAIHGQSFGSRTEMNDLASKYPSRIQGCFNIGLLHTSLSGSSQHDTYAPTSIGTLENAGYEYWGLGHVHIRSEESLSPKCYIGYSGNTQGCHIREAGAKGCNLVTVEDNQLQQVEFMATDSFRWHELNLDISKISALHELDEILHQESGHLMAISEGRPMGIRINLVGNSLLHSELTRPAVRDNVAKLVADHLGQFGDFWLEALKIRSAPAATQELGNVELPVQYLTRVTESARSESTVRMGLRDELEELLKKVRHELGQNSLGSDLESEESFDRHLRDAENQLIAGLLGETA